MKRIEEIKEIIEDIVVQVNVNSIFTNKELEEEYIEQIKSNNFNSMLDFFNEVVEGYRKKVSSAIEEGNSEKFSEYSSKKFNLVNDLKELKQLML